MASSASTIVSVLIGLIIIGILIWLYVEQAMFLFKQQNFTMQGWQNWRRILLIVFVILALISLSLGALGMLLGGTTNSFLVRMTY